MFSLYLRSRLFFRGSAVGLRLSSIWTGKKKKIKNINKRLVNIYCQAAYTFIQMTEIIKYISIFFYDVLLCFLIYS